MAANPTYEAVDFERDEDDLMDGDGAVEVEASPVAPLAPRLWSAITGGAGDSSGVPRKTKGREFKEAEAEAKRNRPFAAKDFESLGFGGGPGPQRCFSSIKKKNQAVKPKALSVVERCPAEQNRSRRSSASTETVLSGGPNILKEKENITSSALEVNRQEKMTVRKLSGSSKLQNEKKNVSLPSKEIDGSAKTSVSLKPSVQLVRSVAQLNDTRKLEGSRNLDMIVSKSFKMLKVGDKNFLKLQKASKYSTTPAHDIVSLEVRKFKNLENATLERDEKIDDGVDFHENIEASGVTLKHQDAQEKKDMQPLFNYVIEETANKLFETRKSNVKALVGAFELVISLQKTKAAHS